MTTNTDFSYFCFFRSPCCSLAQIILPTLNTEPISHACSVLIVGLPLDIIKRVLDPSAMYLQLRRLFIIHLQDLPLLQFQELWEYAAAFDDCCLTLTFDNPGTFQTALAHLSLEGRVERVKEVNAFLAPPYRARAALQLIHDGYALKMTGRLPHNHPFRTLAASLAGQEPLPNGEVYLLDD